MTSFRGVPLRQLLGLAAALWLVGCGGGGVTSSDTGTYRLKVTASTTPVFGMLLTVSGATQAPTLLSVAGVTARVNAGVPGSWKVLLVGPIGSAPFLEVVTGAGSSPPEVTIVDASGGRADGYRALSPGTVTVTPVKQ